MVKLARIAVTTKSRKAYYKAIIVQVFKAERPLIYLDHAVTRAGVCADALRHKL